jgi:hypothetical protein
MLKRIQDAKLRIGTPKVPVPIPDQVEESVDAMVAALIEPGDDAVMINRAKIALQSSLDGDTIYTDDMWGKLFVGNHQALQFANASSYSLDSFLDSFLANF